MWATAASFANAIAPADCLATLQAIITGIFHSLGRSLGSLVGGLIVHGFGYRIAFLTASCIALTMGIIFTVVVAGLTIRGRKTPAAAAAAAAAKATTL